MKNIGILSHNFPYSASDRQNAGVFVGDIARELSKEGKLVVFCPREGGRGNRVAGISVVNFSVLGRKKLGDLKPWNPTDIARFVSFFMGGFRLLKKFIKENKIDVNVVMWAFPSGVFAFAAKKFLGVPYVVWCLGSDIYVYAKYPLMRSVIKRILSSADFVFADGFDLAEKARKLSRRGCLFLPSASKSGFKDLLVKKVKGVVTLAYVGRMEAVKGPDIIIGALSLIKDLRRFRVHMVGGGSLLNSLKENAANLGMGRNLLFYGNINDFQKISGIVRMADWLIIPSRSDSIPLVFSEAMKCGTPIIASDLPDLSYLIGKYKVGYFFKRGDPKNLALIISKLPKKDRDQRRFSRNTKVAAGDFSIEESAKKLLLYLQKI